MLRFQIHDTLKLFMFKRDNKALLDATASRIIRTTLHQLQTRNINRSTRDKSCVVISWLAGYVTFQGSFALDSFPPFVAGTFCLLALYSTLLLINHFSKSSNVPLLRTQISLTRPFCRSLHLTHARILG